MKIVAWNVNSVRAREQRALAWLRKAEPDVVCLQELKVVDGDFPREVFLEAGYHAAVHGQKTYNGVAILSRHEPEDVRVGLRDEVEDPQARLVSARVAGVRVLSAYFPNGGEVGSDKYAYKLEWMARLRAYLDRECDPSEPLALCGDFNVARDDLDIAKPGNWVDTVLTTTEVRDALARIAEWGLRDVVREKNPDGGIYSWWDYRNLGFPKNDGLRIDHILATAPLADACTTACVDRDERKGEKPSDHAPVVAEFGEL